MVNRQVLEGNWNQLKGKVRQKWGQLTDNDLTHFHGNVDELIGTIQKKTGEGREAIETFLEDAIERKRRNGYVGQAAETARQYAHQVSGESARRRQDEAADQVQEGWRVSEYIRIMPGQALAICLGAGLVVGLDSRG